MSSLADGSLHIVLANATCTVIKVETVGCDRGGERQRIPAVFGGRQGSRASTSWPFPTDTSTPAWGVSADVRMLTLACCWCSPAVRDPVTALPLPVHLQTCKTQTRQVPGTQVIQFGLTRPGLLCMCVRRAGHDCWRRAGPSCPRACRTRPASAPTPRGSMTWHSRPRRGAVT